MLKLQKSWAEAWPVIQHGEVHPRTQGESFPAMLDCSGQIIATCSRRLVTPNGGEW